MLKYKVLIVKDDSIVAMGILLKCEMTGLELAEIVGKVLEA